MEYYVQVIETFQRVVRVKASSVKEAREKADNAYNNGDIPVDRSAWNCSYEIDVPIEQELFRMAHGEDVDSID